MSWIILIAAGIFEIGWAVGLKLSEGFTRVGVSVATGAAMLISLGLLGLALRGLPLGVAYAAWTGIGTVGTVFAGILLFGEPVDLRRLACVAAIVAGIVGLKLLTPTAN